MTKNGWRRALLVSAIGALLGTWPGSARAAGFQLIEQNASGLGNAYAGQAATAEDASAVYFNPAGLTASRAARSWARCISSSLRPRSVTTGRARRTSALVWGRARAHSVLPATSATLPVATAVTQATGRSYPMRIYPGRGCRRHGGSA